MTPALVRSIQGVFRLHAKYCVFLGPKFGIKQFYCAFTMKYDHFHFKVKQPNIPVCYIALLARTSVISSLISCKMIDPNNKKTRTRKKIPFAKVYVLLRNLHNVFFSALCI